MNESLQKYSHRLNRKKRIRSQVAGDATRPRLTIFRSNRFIYAQLIDDTTGTVLASAHDRALLKKKISKTDRATEVGTDLAKKALAKKIASVVFDRNGYRFHGRVKAIADGARAGGLTL